MPQWDGTPRAVVPLQAMLESTVPILATPEHAKHSSNEYGVAVYVIDETGQKDGDSGKVGDNDQGQLPMYYISPRLAKSRGRGLQAGWYLVPQVGKKFYVRTTNLTGDSSSARNSTVVIVIRVDGTNIGPHRCWSMRPGRSLVWKGFPQSTKYTQGATEGTQTIREFKFASVNPVSTDAASSTESKTRNMLNTTGCIEVRIDYGYIDDTIDEELPTKEFTGNEAEPTLNIGEKAAIKSVCSVKTAREDTSKVVSTRRLAGKFVIDSSRESKLITIYFREKYWLQSRSIIDGEGNLWKPTIDDAPFNLTEENGNCTASNDGEPLKKKAKTEVVDLTIIKDNIDLTAY